jgi:hypothetical protein
MNGQQKFSEDLAFGQNYENLMVERLKKDYDYVDTTQSKGCFSSYDILCYKFTPNGEYEFVDENDNFINNMDLAATYEVKADRRAKDFGNSLFMEVKCNGKPSGIAISKATHYAYYCERALESEYDLYIIPTNVLRNIIKKHILKTHNRAGDRGAVVGHIIPNNLIAKYSAESKRVGCLIKI